VGINPRFKGDAVAWVKTRTIRNIKELTGPIEGKSKAGFARDKSGSALKGPIIISEGIRAIALPTPPTYEPGRRGCADGIRECNGILHEPGQGKKQCEETFRAVIHRYSSGSGFHLI
jgi:hypothetical protein